MRSQRDSTVCLVLRTAGTTVANINEYSGRFGWTEKEGFRNALDDLRNSSDLVVGWRGFQLHNRWLRSLAAGDGVSDVADQSNHRTATGRLEKNDVWESR